MIINMKNRMISAVLVLLMIITVQPVHASAAGETLFDRYIPINQAYSAKVSPFSAEVGSVYTFYIGTQFRDENTNLAFSEPLKRSQLQGYYFKLNYEGTFGSLDKKTVMEAFNIDENNYLLAMNDPSAKRYENYKQWITKDSIIISIDLYDANKKFVQNVSPATAIIAAGPDGEFLTCSMHQGYTVSIFFSTQDNIYKGTDDKKTMSRVLNFTPEKTWVSDKNYAENLIDAGKNETPASIYQFIQYPEIDGKPQYMTNNILSVNEFISPDNTYYQVGHKKGEIDPVVMNKIENVVDYSEYGLVLTAGNTRRSILTSDGTLYGVTTDYEKTVLAKNVKQAGKAHYMTAKGEVKEIVSGKTIATDCKSFAEHRYATVIGVLKNDGSCYLGYTYLGEQNAYQKGLSKMMDGVKAVVAGGVCDNDNNFYRWKEEVIRKGYDEAAWSRGEFVQYNDYELSLELMTDNAVRVFPDEYFTAQDSTAEEAITGFVVNSDGDVYGFGLQNTCTVGNTGLIKHIFPIYQHIRSGMLDNGNFVGLLPDNSNKPYGLVANHCSNNRPKTGVLPAEYLSDVPGGYKSTDGYTYSFDNDANDGTTDRMFRIKPTEFHYLNDSSEIFKAIDTTTNPVKSLDLLPNVARSSYSLNNAGGSTVLLERTDGSMWMTQIYPKISASDTVAKLGGWECSNAIQITKPTTKKTSAVDYVNLVDFSVDETNNSENLDAAQYIESDYYTQITPAKADNLYSAGKSFLLLVCKSDCNYCKKMKPYIKTAIEREQVPIYGCVDDYGAIQFYWDFVSEDTVGTPLFVLVNGKNNVEVKHSARNESDIDAILKKAKSIGVTTDNSSVGKSDIQSKLPSDKISVNKAEWEVLSLVNRERFNNGLNVLAMPADLQGACDTRESELLTLYSHTRPNGEQPFTAIPSSLKYRTAAENIASGQRNPTEVVTAWMNSPGHRANTLNPDFAYIGVGFVYNNPAYWVQLFADTPKFTTVTTSAGTMNFASESDMKKEYIICTDENGVVSYLPIDTSVMTKNGNTYTLKLSGKTVALTIGNEQTVGAFSDVKQTDWFADSVAWAVNKKITAGTSETTFSPNDTCTRAQILTFLWRAVGSPKTGITNPFKDVKTTDYYYDAALWASKNGMVSGTAFDGSTLCTRSSTVIYLWKNAGAPKNSTSTDFTDVPEGSEYAQAVSWAVKTNVTSGTSKTTFSPDDTCTRGQIVTFLNRAIK